MTRWPNQVRTLDHVPTRVQNGAKRILVTSPTGTGKSVSICDLIEWAVNDAMLSALYTNRRLLIEQLARTLDKQGIAHGVRAAGHADNRERPVQISSLPTERTRVLKAERWEVHGHGRKVFALVDEAHLNKADTAKTILDRHVEHGGAYAGFTATPIDLGHMYDELFVAGTMSEMRSCGALVPAYHYGPDEPDMASFKQNVKTGEYSEGDVVKAIMTKCVFARVLEWFEKLNPERRPTILFAPGVAESIWFAEQFSVEGVRAAHIDGNGIWLDGEYRRCNLDEREDVLLQVRSGEIKVLCNRFVAREGLDLPEVSHIIAATVFGALQSFLQSVGRGLRSCPGKDRLTIQDHGGNDWRHGSVNMDREWRLEYTENIISGMRADRLREKKEPEPIRCPECSLIRKSGPRCPACGHESTKQSRMVIQHDGSLKEHVGDIFKPRRVLMKKNTARLWESCYYRAKNSKNHMTFRQAMGLFFYENHYYPPSDLKFMPTNEFDGFMPVKDIPKDRLVQ